MVRRASSTGGAKIEGFSQSLVVASRVLMWLIVVLLFVAPWTEHYGTFDNFPHGQDFELSLFAFLALLCLMLLLAQLRKQWLKDPPAVRDDWEWCLICEPPVRTPDTPQKRIALLSHSPPRGSHSPGPHNLPLQI
jgi:hypothetical protein